MPGSIINRAFALAYNEAAELYDTDQLEACIEKCNEILHDSAAPRYHRMKTWVLLNNVLGDWEEANECLVKAESMWRIVRRWNVVGKDAEVDASLDELRGYLDELKAALDAEKATDYDVEKAGEVSVDAVQEEKARP